MMEIVHATALVFGTDGVLIRGPSGSGKSLLARDLLDRAKLLSIYGNLVSDDQVVLRAKSDRLIGEAHPQTAGMIEIRNRGIVKTRYQKSAIIRLVVDLVPQADLERMPEKDEFLIDIMDLTLPLQKLPAGQRVALDIISETVGRLVPRG